MARININLRSLILVATIIIIIIIYTLALSENGIIRSQNNEGRLIELFMPFAFDESFEISRYSKSHTIRTTRQPSVTPLSAVVRHRLMTVDFIDLAPSHADVTIIDQIVIN